MKNIIQSLEGLRIFRHYKKLKIVDCDINETRE